MEEAGNSQERNGYFYLSHEACGCVSDTARTSPKDTTFGGLSPKTRSLKNLLKGLLTKNRQTPYLGRSLTRDIHNKYLQTLRNRL